MGDKVLVTGGAGFIGSHVAAACVERGYEVFILDNLSTGDSLNTPDGAVRFFIDIRDVEGVTHLFKSERFKYVYHFAAKAVEAVSHWIRRDIYENNLMGSINLINAAIETGVECFVFAGTLDIYNVRPDPYGIAKQAVMDDLLAAWNEFGLPSVTVIMSNVYGPRMCMGEVYRNVVGTFIRHLLHKEPIPIFGDGSVQRPFTYVGDIAGEIAALPDNNDHDCSPVTMINPQQESVARVATLLRQHLRVPEHTDWRPARPHEEKVLALPMQVDRSWTSLDGGLRQTVEWARDAHARNVLNFRSSKVIPEITKRIPEVWKQYLK